MCRVGNKTWLLGYDAEGHLVSLQKQGDSVGWVYEYDGLGRRVRAVRGTSEVVYLYSGDTLVAEGSRQRSGDPFQWVYYGYGGSMYQQATALAVGDAGVTVAEGGVALGEGIKHVGGTRLRWEDLIYTDPSGSPGDAFDQALETPAHEMWKRYPGGRR